MALNEITVLEVQATAKKIEEQNSVNNYDSGVLSQFRANIDQVEELSRRMRFIVGEVHQLIVKKRS